MASPYENINMNQQHDQTNFTSMCSTNVSPMQINQYSTPPVTPLALPQPISSSYSKHNNVNQRGYLLPPNTVMNLLVIPMQQRMSHINTNNVSSMTFDAKFHKSDRTFCDQQLLIPSYNQTEYTRALSSDNSTFFDIQNENVPFQSSYPSSGIMNPLPSTSSITVKQKNPLSKRLPITKLPSSQIAIKAKGREHSNFYGQQQSVPSDLNNDDPTKSINSTISRAVYIPTLTMEIVEIIPSNISIQDTSSTKHIANDSLIQNQENEFNETVTDISESGNVEIYYNVPDLEMLKVEMKDILKTTMNQKEEVIEEALAKLLADQAGNVEAVRVAIDSIIENALNMKPRLSTHCARKSAAICWMVHSFWRSVSNNEIEWKWSDQAFNQMKKLDIFEILKEQSLMKFYYELQVGDDRDKFVNIMVLMSELYNKDLLYVFTIVDVIGAILCERNLHKVGSNDIHGLYEIFKRCSRRLRRSRARKDIEHYLSVIDRVSLWKKFLEYQSVEFKIKEMSRFYYR